MTAPRALCRFSGDGVCAKGSHRVYPPGKRDFSPKNPVRQYDTVVSSPSLQFHTPPRHSHPRCRSSKSAFASCNTRYLQISDALLHVYMCARWTLYNATFSLPTAAPLQPTTDPARDFNLVTRPEHVKRRPLSKGMGKKETVTWRCHDVCVRKTFRLHAFLCCCSRNNMAHAWVIVMMKYLFYQGERRQIFIFIFELLGGILRVAHRMNTFTFIRL